MALRYTDTQQSSHLDGVKVLGYGRSGMGKTALCITAPKPLIISAESGLLVLNPANIARLEQHVGRALPRNAPVIEIGNYEELVQAYQFCVSPQAAQFETFCLDSISEIAEKVLAHAKSTAKDPRQAYGVLIEKTLECLKAFRDINGKHVYFSAKQALLKDENSGITMYGPDMPGAKLGPAMPYIFDLVFNINTAKTAQGQDYRYLRTRPDLQYDAKDRSGSLAEIERPDLTYLFNKIAGAHA